MANQLSNESSPYLLQHANNPVHWKAWNKDSLTQAQAAAQKLGDPKLTQIIPRTEIRIIFFAIIYKLRIKFMI